jgi:hypothetical protein
MPMTPMSISMDAYKTVMLSTSACLSQIEHPNMRHTLRPCKTGSNGVFPSVIVAYWSRARGFSQVIVPSMRLCSSGYFKGMMSPQWNSLITVLVPSLRRVAGGFTRCLAMFIAGQINSHLWQRQSSRSKCGVAAIYPGPSIMYGRTNIPDGVKSRI